MLYLRTSLSQGYDRSMPIKDPQKRKEYQREYGRKWYLKNRDRVIASNKKNKRKRHLKWLEYKSTFSCSECGIKHPALIDFHHKDGETKETEVSTFVNQGQYSRAYEEVKKCIPLCPHCHRVHHWNERKKNERTT